MIAAKGRLALWCAALVAALALALPLVSCAQPREQPPTVERPINGDGQQILVELRAQGGHFADVARVLQGLEQQIIKLNEATVQLRQRSKMERPLLRAIVAIEALLLLGVIGLFWAFRRRPPGPTSPAT